MLDIELDETQTQIVDSLRRALPPLNAGSHSSGSLSDLNELAGLGTFLLGVDEEKGGIGFSLLEEVVAYRELGRACTDPTVLAQTMGVHLAMSIGRSDLAASFGDATVRVSMAPEDNRADGGTDTLYIVNGDEDGWLLSINPYKMRLLPISAIEAREKLEPTDDRLKVERARILQDAPNELALTSEKLSIKMMILASAMLVGASEGARDQAVEYSKLRKQFGEFIGAFQAIKHKCADMAVRSEAAWCLTVQAAFDALDEIPGASSSVASAVRLALGAAKRNAEENIQIHGGIGFTDECSAHLFLKHALAIEQLWLALYAPYYMSDACRLPRMDRND